jgi:4-hydroxy-2-oxoheptanedioate aldolase
MLTEGRKLREKLKSGQVCFGTWSDSSDPCLVEILCGAGFDFLLIDSEHGALHIESVQRNLMAAKGTGVAPLVRVPWNDPVLIKPVLDSGAAGILVPLVKTAEEARLAVAACLYPPAGVRGFGPRRPSNYEREASDYIPQANESVAIWVQIEHIDAIRNIDEIARTPRLDGLFIGSNDLSASIGLLGQPRHPDVLAAIDRVIAAGRAAGVPVGIAGPGDPHAAYDWIEKGMQFITLSAVTGMLITAADSAATTFRGLLKAGSKKTQ